MDLIDEICRDNLLIKYAEEYVLECEECVCKGEKKARSRFPNLAGFCRKLGVSISRIKRVEREYPEQYGALIALLEDEALNSGPSATILTTYMKERLGFGENKNEGGEAHSGEVRLIFEHDVYEDGQ